MHARSVSRQQNLFVILSDALSLSAGLLVRLSQGQPLAHYLSTYNLYRTYKGSLLIRPAYAHRYKLCISAGDETGETEFVIFGRIAQRLTRKPVDTLIADNPTGFIPDEVTRLLEKVFVWNVSFTENTIATGIVSFQVNSIVAQLDGDNALSVTPIGSQSSSLMLSKDASSSMQNTPQKSVTSTFPLPPATSEASHASSETPIKVPLLMPGVPATPESCKPTAEDEVGCAYSFQYKLFSCVFIQNWHLTQLYCMCRMLYMMTTYLL